MASAGTSKLIMRTMVMVMVTAMVIKRMMMMMAIRFSIILVAFDLEEFGSQGAQVFLHDFLLPKVYNHSFVITCYQCY